MSQWKGKFINFGQSIFMPLTSGGYVFTALKSGFVQKPGHDILDTVTVIMSTKLVEEPFKELQEFRCECINAFPVTHLKSMRIVTAG